MRCMQFNDHDRAALRALEFTITPISASRASAAAPFSKEHNHADRTDTGHTPPLRKLGFATCDDHARCKRVVVEIIAPADNTEHCWLGIHCPGGIIALPIPAEKVLIAAGVKASEAA